MSVVVCIDSSSAVAGPHGKGIALAVLQTMLPALLEEERDEETVEEVGVLGASAASSSSSLASASPSRSSVLQLQSAPRTARQVAIVRYGSSVHSCEVVCPLESSLELVRSLGHSTLLSGAVSGGSGDPACALRVAVSLLRDSDISNISSISSGSDVIIVGPISGLGGGSSSGLSSGSFFSTDAFAQLPPSLRVHVVDTSVDTGISDSIAQNPALRQFVAMVRNSGSYRSIVHRSGVGSGSAANSALPGRGSSSAAITPLSKLSALRPQDRIVHSVRDSLMELVEEKFAPWHGMLACGQYEAEISLHPPPADTGLPGGASVFPTRLVARGTLPERYVAMPPTTRRHSVLLARPHLTASGEPSIVEQRKRSRSQNFLHLLSEALLDRRLSLLVDLSNNGTPRYGLISSVRVEDADDDHALALCLDVLASSNFPHEPDFLASPWLGPLIELGATEMVDQYAKIPVDDSMVPLSSSSVAMTLNPFAWTEDLLQVGGVPRAKSSQYAAQFMKSRQFGDALLGAIPPLTQEYLDSQAARVLQLARSLPDQNSWSELWVVCDRWRAVAQFYGVPGLMHSLLDLLECEISHTEVDGSESVARVVQLREVAHVLADAIDLKALQYSLGSDLVATLSPS